MLRLNASTRQHCTASTAAATERDICVRDLEGRTLTMLAIIMLPTMMRAGPTAYGGMEAAQFNFRRQFLHQPLCRTGSHGKQQEHASGLEHVHSGWQSGRATLGLCNSWAVRRPPTEDGVEEQRDDEEAADGEAGDAGAAALADAGSRLDVGGRGGRAEQTCSGAPQT